MPEAVQLSQLRKVLSVVPTPITLVSVDLGNGPEGMIVGSFVSVSLDPPLVGICVQKTSTTWPRLRKARKLGISVLGTHHERAVRQLAGPAGHRFAGVEVDTTSEGVVYLRGASAHMEVSIQSEQVAGDHTFSLLKVHEVVSGDVPSLVFHESTIKLLEG